MGRVQKTGHLEVVVDAAIEDVWRVVSDVTRTGEWSHECVQVRWLDGATSAAVGARFRGRNRAGVFRWGRICRIVTADEPREIAWQTVPTLLYPDSTLWRLKLEPVGERTRIVQEFQVLRAPKVLDYIYAAAIPRHQDRNARLTADLESIGAVAKASAARKS